MGKTFGERIKNARIDMDMSQKEMSILIPMNQSNYSKIENGKQEPSIYQLKRISEILQVSVDELLGIDRVELDDAKLKNFQREFDLLFRKYFSN